MPALTVHVTGQNFSAIRQRLPPDLEMGQEIPGPEGAKVTYEGLLEFRSVGIPPEWDFLITVVGQISATLIAAWILDTFRGSDRVTINRREIELDDAGKVRRIVEEELRSE